MKKWTALFLTLCLTLFLSSCGSAAKQETSDPAEIMVFAAASMQESLDAVIELYQRTTPNVKIIVTYDSSGTLKTQIQEGAPCDLFISASPKQINALDGSMIDNLQQNPDGLDLIVQGSRVDLLENRVTLAVPEGNPAAIESFGQLADLLKTGNVILAIGNSDVPVGQYTQKIFAYFNIDETAVAGHLTYGSNVKEVTTQISAGAADCGIIYGTDAFSAGLTVVDEATSEMCGQVLYPAAVISTGSQQAAAQAFLNYLSSDTANACFKAVGFSPLI